MPLLKPIALVAALVLSLLLSRPAQAQPLAVLVPEDALIYVGWSGASDMGPAYAASHLKAVLDASNIPQVFDQYLPRLATMLGERGPGGSESIAPIGAISWAMWKYPTAFYFGGFDFPENGPPMPRAAFICKAGKESKELFETIQAYAGEEGETPFKVTEKDGLVVVTMGKVSPLGKGLTGNARFAAAMKQVGSQPVFVAYADFEGIFASVDAGMKKMGPPEQAAEFLKMREAMGFNGLKGVVLTAGFEGKDWATRAFIEAPAGGRTGMLAMLDAKPVSDEALKMVPQSAAWVAAFRFDVGKLVADIKTTIVKLDPRMKTQIEESFKEVNEMLGMDIEKDLLAAMGDEWIIYTDAQVAGTGMMGMVTINRARDGKKLAASLAVLGKAIDNAMSRTMRLPEGDASYYDEDGKIVEPKEDDANAPDGSPRLVRTYNAKGVKVQFLSIPAVSPAWAVDGDVLYMALYPQVIPSAVASTRKGGPSILDQPAFVDLQKRMTGGAKASAVSYVDLPQTAGEGYQVALLVSQLMLGAGDMLGVQSPPLVLPPLHMLRPHLTPSSGASWTDALGWHGASITPFPGAEIIGTQHQVFISAQAMTVGILLPALGSARKTAQYMQSATHTRGLQSGCVLYAQGARDQYPPDLATLLEGNYFSPEYLISPRETKQIPKDLMTWDKKKRAEWVNANSSYCYVTGLTADNDSTKVVIFERLHSPNMNVVAVCFNDNHAQTLPIAEASALIKKQTGRTLEEWSKAKNPGAGGK